MRLQRRDLLRAAAAIAAGGGAALAWRRASAPGPAVALRRPAGRIWGQEHELAHRLRADDLRRRPPDEQARADVLVIGSGIAGLTCAWRLRREGLEGVELVDVAPAPGGNSRGGANEVSPFPWGAHYLRAPTTEHRALERLLEDVGLIRGRDSRGRIDWDSRAVVSAPDERLWEGGLWAEGLHLPPRSATREDRDELARFSTFIEELGRRRDGQGRRAFTLPVESSSRDPELLALDRVSFRAWLDAQGYRSPALRWYLDYACRDDYGCSLETTSAWAGLHYLAARETDDPSRDVTLAWPEGNARLARLLAEGGGGGRGPVRFRGETPCVALTPGAAPGEPSLARLWDARRDRIVQVEARHVVWAAPRFVLARVLDAPPPGTSAFTYAPWLAANVTLEVAPGGIGAPLAWDNVFYGAPSLGYVVANRDAPPDAPCVVTWYRSDPDPDTARARARLMALDHPAVVDLVLEELLAVHPSLAGAVRSVDAWRWGHAMIRPVPGFIWGEARAAALAPIGALLCAHSDLSGIPVFEEALYRGVLAAEVVLRRDGRTFESLL